MGTRECKGKDSPTKLEEGDPNLKKGESDNWIVRMTNVEYGPNSL